MWMHTYTYMYVCTCNPPWWERKGNGLIFRQVKGQTGDKAWCCLTHCLEDTTSSNEQGHTSVKNTKRERSGCLLVNSTCEGKWREAKLSKVKIKYSPELVKSSQVYREFSSESTCQCFCPVWTTIAGLCASASHCLQVLSCTEESVSAVADHRVSLSVRTFEGGLVQSTFSHSSPYCSQGNCFETKEKGEKHWVKWGRENTVLALCYCMNICFHLTT